VKVLAISLGAVMLTGLVLAFVLSSCGSSGSVSLVTEKTVSSETTGELRMRSSAMEPTVHCAKGEGVGCEGDVADRLLVRAPARTIRRANIVAFRAPALASQQCGAGGVFVMRVVGLSGDVWELRDGFSYVNGRRLEEDYVRPASRDSQTLTLADIPPRDTYKRIPSGHYLLMGDNRNSSCDSRRWGLVPRASVVGTVVQILRPTP
jgi:signal peptidase I